MRLFENAQVRSVVRGALKLGGGVLAAKFGLSEADVITLTDQLVALGGAATALYGFYLSWKDKRAVVAE